MKAYKVCDLYTTLTNVLGFFQLPRLSKPKQDSIIEEVKHDLENSGIWTPSKLVEALNRQIIS